MDVFSLSFLEKQGVLSPVEYIHGTVNIVFQDRLRRVVFTSSTGVYAQDDGSWVNEQSPVQPQHYTGQTMLEAERTLTNIGISSVILRLSGIYGPHRASLIERLRDGRERLWQGAHRVLNLIHRDDAARAIVHVLTLPSPDPVYIASDSLPSQRNEILTWLAQEMALGPLGIHEGNEPTSFRGNKRCSNKALIASGFRLQFPDFRAGYGALLKESQD